jgi:hypothetical protein
MNELTLDGKTYVSSKRAAEITGYAKDYVGQLCREGHVEARLVGRNWYVLESSIRDHRFGTKGEAAESQKKSAATWEAPRYVTEVPAFIPPVGEKAKEEALEEVREAAAQRSTPNLSDMEDAWQEWFTKKQSEVPPTEAASAAINVSDPEEADGEESITIHQIKEQEEKTSIEQPFAPSYEPEALLDLTKASEPETEEEEPVEEIKALSALFPVGNLVIKSVLVGICLISVAVAAIGTGFATRFTDFSKYRLSEINLLSGVSVYNK